MKLLTHTLAFALGVLAFIAYAYRWLDKHWA